MGINNKKETEQRTLQGVRQHFYCQKCKGYTYDVDWCENPCCPNMPCCGKPRELCNCEETGGKKV